MRARQLIEVIGREWVPPHQNLDSDAELELAAKWPFSAWEYALRTNKPHPKLQQTLKGSPYEPLYNRHFKLPQSDPFYESVIKILGYVP